MKIEFAKAINDGLSELSAKKRNIIIDNLCDALGYVEELPEGGTISKKDFIDGYYFDMTKKKYNKYLIDQEKKDRLKQPSEVELL